MASRYYYRAGAGFFKWGMLMVVVMIYPEIEQGKKNASLLNKRCFGRVHTADCMFTKYVVGYVQKLNVQRSKLLVLEPELRGK